MTRRSPAMMALLLAATACVDAVAIYDLLEFSDDSTSQLLAGLVAGQLSVACLWASFAASIRPVQWAIPAGAMALAALPYAYLNDADFLVFAAATFATQASLLMTALWILKRMPWWRRKSPHTAEPSWQFSLVDLLLTMTAAAVWFLLLRAAMTEPAYWLGYADFAAQSVAIALAAACAAAMSRSLLYRLAILLGVTLLVAAWPLRFGAPFYIAVGVIQAIVLFVWLELAAIIPPASESREGESATAGLQDAAPAADQTNS